MKNYELLDLDSTIDFSSLKLDINSLPSRMTLHPELGIVSVNEMSGLLVYREEELQQLFECRCEKTPSGDYLLMAPCGEHYADSTGEQHNWMYSWRSSDKGKTWEGPRKAFEIDYNQHGFVPLVPRGSNRMYCFGTQPVWAEWDYSEEHGQRENAPIGYFISDDDGWNWTGPFFIRPEEDPSFKGMSVTRMTETDSGAWLIGSHIADWSKHPLTTSQYLLRSVDKGKTWHIIPDARPNGWQCPGFNRMDEGRVLNIGGGKVLFMIRTPEGHLWASHSEDDGKTWTTPVPTDLIQPDAPPMIELMPDGNTVICLYHNRHHDTDYTGLSSQKKELMGDRSELWFTVSTDGGYTWAEPRWLFSNALKPTLASPFRNFQCSYVDIMFDEGKLKIFVPHRWQQILLLEIALEDLASCPTKEDILG